jgi:hypothetical protein
MTSLTPFLAPDADPPAGLAHQRTDPRSNMFVMATLYHDGDSTPVRVRNLSRGGALIEAAVLPPDQARVRLSRGSLSVRGQLVWLEGNRAGLRFDTAVEVAPWLPGGSRPSHQQRIDEMVQACRQSPGGGSEPPAPSAVGQARAVRELLDLRDTLNAVAEELAGDTSIAMAHATALQRLDVAAQALDKLAAAQIKPG